MLSSKRRRPSGIQRLIDDRVDRALDEGLEVGAAEEARPLGEPLQIELLGRALSHEELENPSPCRLVGRGNEQQTVEATRPLDCLVDVPWSVCRPEDENAFVVGTDRVELLQELVDERTPCASDVPAAGESDGIELVEKEDAWRRAPCLLEDVVQVSLADSYERIEDFLDPDVRERQAAFRRSRPREQGLAAARRAVEKDPASSATTVAFVEVSSLERENDGAVNGLLDVLEPSDVIEGRRPTRFELHCCRVAVGPFVARDLHDSFETERGVDLASKTRHSFDDVGGLRSEEHTSALQSRGHIVCRFLLEKKKTYMQRSSSHTIHSSIYTLTNKL